ncbi:hypothetical protein PACILC2_14020 [Paenibacillus cisolokensis]|uniref:Flagellar hook-associated protein 2 N-terminal domain-containing protein n=1 Tax=Paenibacillus cisolokensis TaxID=1658519 RepID=A0ABQ4N3W0_9BACL|nr:hypothetical protein PACILC2_14020 [Paenibacillus cisolokensis]
MGISISGLGSGLDTAQIISDLMTLERQPYTRLETSKKKSAIRKVYFPVDQYEAQHTQNRCL